MNRHMAGTVSSSALTHKQVSVSERSVRRPTFISSITGAAKLATRSWSRNSNLNLMQPIPLILWNEPDDVIDPVYLFCIAAYLRFFSHTVSFFFHTVSIPICFLHTMILFSTQLEYPHVFYIQWCWIGVYAFLFALFSISIHYVNYASLTIFYLQCERLGLLC